MSRIAAVANRIEAIILAITPETRTVAGAKFIRSDKPLLNDAAARSFYLDSAGDFQWSGELSQDREGSIMDETLDLTISYTGSPNQRAIRDVIRQDVIRIQYELLDPGNWIDAENQWRCQRRAFGGVSVSRTGDGDGAQIIVTIPITITYRPF